MPSPGQDVMSWSTTAANNGTADLAINWAEGQPRASVNDSSRAEMAALAKWRDLHSGVIATTGTANAQAFTSGIGYTGTVPTGLSCRLRIGNGLTNTGPVTLNMDGIGPTTVYNQYSVPLTNGELYGGSLVDFFFNGASWIALNTAATTLRLNKPTSGSNSGITGETNGVLRWMLVLGDSIAETGSNTGSNFELVRFNDAGAVIDYPFQINRATGAVTLGTVGGTSAFLGIALLGTLAGQAGVVENAQAVVRCAQATVGLAVRATTQGAQNAGLYFFNTIDQAIGSIVVDDTAGATYYNTSSDVRLKENISSYRGGREIIDKLNVVSFNWKRGGESNVGILAQEAQKVYPKAVIEGKGEVGESGFVPWSTDYSKYVPLLIQALQDAHARIDALEKQIAVCSNPDKH
jgi:hypothetical protein